MKGMKSPNLNKEQWTALAAVATGALMLLSSASAGIGPSEGLPPLTADRAYEPARFRGSELPDEKFERYWQGKDIFKAETSERLPIPPLKAPEPREEDLPAFPFRPSPAFERYNALPLPQKYPALTAGQPLVAEANLPSAAEVAELVKTEEPALPVRVDRRAERERELLVVQLHTGTRMEGREISFENDTDLIFRDKNGQRVPLKKKDIRSILYNRTHEEEYKRNSAKIPAGPKESDERVKLARQLLDWGMVPEALDELKAALAAKPDHAEAAVLRGALAREVSDFEGALATYQDAIEAGAPPGDLHHEIGRCLQELGLHEGALAAFEKALEAQPRHHRARLGLARSQFDLGAGAAVVESVNDFFLRAGSAPDLQAAHRAEAHLLRGLGWIREGQLDKAREDLAKALDLDAGALEAVNALGAIHALEGKYPQAAPAFVKAIRGRPYLTEAWTNLANLFLLGGKWAEAEQLYAAAAQRDPASVEALLGRGVAQLMAGKKDGVATLERAAAAGPGHPIVNLVMGHVRLREGADEEALARFTEVLRSEFHFLPAYSGAAAAYLKTARALVAGGADDAKRRKAQELRVNAETLIRALKDFDPNRASFWALLGSCYAVTGRADEARQSIRMALNLASQSQKAVDPFLLYTAGYLEYHHGQAETDEARLDLAQREFEQGAKLKGQFADPYSVRVIADCEAAVELIENWKVTTVRFDERFEGDTAKSIGGGWIEADDRNGISISREYFKETGGRAKFDGVQVGRDWALTSLSRDIPGQGFQSMEVTLMPVRAEKAEVGVSLLYAQQESGWTGFHLGIDAAGKVRYQPHGSDRDMDGRDMSVGWLEVRTPLPNPKEVTLRLALGQKGRATHLTLSFWDAAKGEWIVANKEIPVNVGAGRGNWRVAAWARAWKGQPVLLYVDNFRVFERARR